MSWKLVLFCSLASLPMVISGFAQAVAPLDGLRSFEQRAARFKSVVNLPHFETSTQEVNQTVSNTIAAGNAALDRIASLNPRRVTFQNTVRALDDIGYDIGRTANRLSLIKETGPSAELRDGATEA